MVIKRHVRLLVSYIGTFSIYISNYFCSWRPFKCCVNTNTWNNQRRILIFTSKRILRKLGVTNDFVKWNWYFLLYFHAHFLLNCHNHFFVYSTFVLRNIFAFFSCLIFCWRKLTVGQQKIYDKSLTRKSNVCLHHANVFFSLYIKQNT